METTPGMHYYLMPLTIEESKDSVKKQGYGYAVQHKDRWITIDNVKDEINTYDRGTTVLVYNDRVYQIKIDFTNINDNYRVYIGLDMNMDSDDKNITF